MEHETKGILLGVFFVLSLIFIINYRPIIIHNVNLREFSDIPSPSQKNVKSQVARMESNQRQSAEPRAPRLDSNIKRYKLKPTATNGYTVNPQRPAPPPPPPPK